MLRTFYRVLVRGAAYTGTDRPYATECGTAGLLRGDDRRALRRIVRFARGLQGIAITVVLLHRRVNFASGDRAPGRYNSVQSGILVAHCGARYPDRQLGRSILTYRVILSAFIFFDNLIVGR